MENKTNLEESFNLAEMILLYISKNEPMDTPQLEEMIKQSGLDDDKIRLNIARLKSAGLIEGHLISEIGIKYFSHVIQLRLSYAGLKEIDELLKRKRGIKEIEVDFGLLKFKI